MKKYLILIILLLIITGCGTKEDNSKEIVIGFNADQSSVGTGIFGQSAVQGFSVAIGEINKTGGILGRMIKPVILDDEADPALSTENMKKLVEIEKAIAVIGPANSANALKWLDYAQEKETIVIVPIATASEITTKFMDRPRNYIFRVNSLDSTQSSLYVAWIYKQTNNGKIAIIHDTTPYGQKGLKDVSEVMSRWGKSPIHIESFDPGAGEVQFVEMLNSIKASKADGIAILCYADAQAGIIKALQKIPGFKPVLVGSSSALSPELFKLAGKDADQLAFVAGTTYDINEGTEYLGEKIHEYFDNKPVAMSVAAHAHDSVLLLKSAIEEADSFDNKKIRDALENLPEVKGVVKTYKKPFSQQNHEALGTEVLYMAHWVDGKITKLPDGDPEQLEIR